MSSDFMVYGSAQSEIKTSSFNTGMFSVLHCISYFIVHKMFSKLFLLCGRCERNPY